MLVPTRVADLVAAICVVLLAGVIASRYLDERFDFSFRDCSEDLLYPCVSQLGMTLKTAPLEASPHWQAFVQRRIDVLDCEALKDLPRVDAGHTWDLQRYLHVSLAGLFWLVGPRRSVFISYLTLMFSLTVLACYGLFRLGASPPVASMAVLPIIFSDLHLRSTIHPVEYVKAPFILGCLFLVGAIVRRRHGVRITGVLSLAAGLIVGLGVGFKPDVLICVPITVVAIAVFAPTPFMSWRKALAIALFLVAVVCSGWPVLKAQFFGGWGSLLPVQVLGGMDRSFADYYAQPSLYDYGVRFDDAHVTRLINSYNQRVHNSTAEVGFYSKEMERAATLLLLDLDRTFPSDLVLRTWAAIINILKLSRVGLPAALVVVPLLLVTNPRLGSFVVFLLVSAVGYVSLVFQPKHFFHLEWVPWWFVAVIAEQAVFLLRSQLHRTNSTSAAHHQWRWWALPYVRRTTAVLLLVAAISGTFVLVRRYQQSQVTSLVETYMRASSNERLTTVTTMAVDGSMRMTVEGLGSALRLTPRLDDYLVLDVRCAALEDADLVAVYEQPTSPREPMTVPCSTGSQHWKLFWPIYQYQPSARFERFEWTGVGPIRVDSLRRVTDLSQVRLLLKLAVPDDYRGRPWYQVLRRNFYFDPLGVRPSPKG